MVTCKGVLNISGTANGFIALLYRTLENKAKHIPGRTRPALPALCVAQALDIQLDLKHVVLLIYKNYSKLNTCRN